ncbi:putative metallo-beta-lactamase domain protein [Thermoascus aurantiacus ATCC 26904]
MAESAGSPLDLLVCSTCGSQHAVTASAGLKSCRICDDPRQYLPATGQSWTTLRALQQSKQYRNEFVIDKIKDNLLLVSIYTVPKFAIGQRALLCCSPRGNVLWDCLTYIDDETVNRIKQLGGVRAIVISHPHYYSTCLHWAEAFGCRVYLSAEDAEWVMRRGEEQVFWQGARLPLLTSSTTTSGDGDADAEFIAIKTGGHFPGSSVLWWPRTRKLLVADTIMVVPSGVYHVDRLPGTVSFSFMWSYPNFIPLPPDAIHTIWKAIKDIDFDDAHGAFVSQDTRGDSRRRVLESAKRIVAAMGYVGHAIHAEEA